MVDTEHDAARTARPEEEKRRLFSDILRVLSHILDMDEGQKLHHAWRVGVIAYHVAETMGLDDVDDVYTAALLHDIGSMGLSNHLVHLVSQGVEDEGVRAHPAMGAKILAPIEIFAPIIPMIADHHERFDGRGYPKGKSAEEIPVQASIILLADTLDIALRSTPSGERQRRALRILDKHQDKVWPKSCSDAAKLYFEDNPGFVESVFDGERLEAIVGTINPEPRGLADVSRLELLSQLLWVLARIVDAKHESTMGHTIRTAYYALQISRVVAGDEINSWDVLWAGLLHDVGKVGVPRALLDKKGPLTPDEWVVVERHATDSLVIISGIQDLAHLAYPAAAHHERYDGRGYPHGRAGEEIPLLGRILAYADVFDALTSSRSYREAITAAEGVRRLRQIVGSHLDPHMADAALAVLAECGDRVLTLPTTMQGFYRFFEADGADLTRLLNRGGITTVTAPATSERGLMLVEHNSWTRARFSDQLMLLSGTEDIAALVTEIEGDVTGPQLEIALRGLIVEHRAQLAADGTHAQYLFVADTAPFDVLLVLVDSESDAADRSPIDVYVRTASEKFLSMERMALLYRNFFSTSDAIFFTDAAATIIDVNQTFTDVFGHHLDSVVGAHPDVVLPAGRHGDVLGRCLDALRDAERGTWEGESEAITDTQVRVPVHFTIMSVQDATGVVTGYVGRLQDISERKRLEAEVRQRNDELEGLNRLKSDLMAVTSHDLKSPINSMISYGSLLKMKGESLTPDDVQRYATLIVDSGQRLISFINDMLDIDKIESGDLNPEFAPTDVIDLLRRSVGHNAVTGSQRNIEVKLEAEVNSTFMMLDDARMEQVFNNIISNAVKFSPEGGAVRVRFRIDPEHGVRISVEDDGPGIPESDLALVFDRYYQAKRRGRSARTSGAGLGLNIASKILGLHGGSIFAENRDTQGCRMLISLPMERLNTSPNHPTALVFDVKDEADTELVLALAAAGLKSVLVSTLDRVMERLDSEPPGIVFLCEPGDAQGDVLKPIAARAAELGAMVVGIADNAAYEFPPNIDRVLIKPVVSTEIAQVLRVASAKIAVPGEP